MGAERPHQDIGEVRGATVEELAEHARLRQSWVDSREETSEAADDLRESQARLEAAQEEELVAVAALIDFVDSYWAKRGEPA